ncbi:MAG: putative N6-adenine-specific DNA methylase [Planctomycetota bacterium]|jgi:putative N6-adenine-specific DNA methylase
MSSPIEPKESNRTQAQPPKKGNPVSRTSYFVTCAPGLEPVLHEELRALRFAKVERQVGGAYFEGNVEDEMRANLELRTAVRVLRRLCRFRADDSESLYEGALAVDWSQYLAPGGSILIAAHTRNSELDHSHFIEQRVKDAICDQQRNVRGGRPEVDKDNPDLRIDVHLFKDRCTLSVDTSGEPLHKRGWRRFQGGAPLAENLAAGLVLLSGWDRRSPVVDPFCGSATLLIEAALIAADAAPGLYREHFGFQSFPDHNPKLWHRLKEAAKERRKPIKKLRLVGTDASSDVIGGAGANVVNAGLEENISLSVACAEDFKPKRGWNAWILTNPPYGERLGNARELADVYRRLGRALKDGASGYSLVMFSGNKDLTTATGIKFASRMELANGALPCELCIAQL